MKNMSSEELYEARKEFFNERAENWLDMWYKDQETGKYDRYEKEFQRLFSLVPIKDGDHVLDVGCGSGVLVPYILERILDNGVLYELDYAEKMIEVNKRLHNDKRIKFLVSDIIDVPLESCSCDLVICFSCFPHFQEKGQAMRAMARMLKKGGWLSVAHFDSSEELNNHHRKTSGPVMHDKLPDKKAMKRLFVNSGLKTEKFIDESGFYLILGQLI
ncbi:MAG: class I SAM-dependent methyltransferase [Deltaproteobacteria bacterium]|nr:class I SAM-dependent methyltransferase [Deltaproteobacteria bacterium]